MYLGRAVYKKDTKYNIQKYKEQYTRFKLGILSL